MARIPALKALLLTALISSCSFCEMLITQDNPFHPLLAEYLLKDNYELHPDVKTDDSKEQCAAKILMAIRHKKKVLAKYLDEELEEGTTGKISGSYRNDYDSYCKKVHDAYVNYPEEPLFIALVAEVLIYCEFNGPKYPGDPGYPPLETTGLPARLRNDWAAAITMLAPLAHGFDDIPRIKYMLWQYFYNLERRLDSKQDIVAGDFVIPMQRQQGVEPAEAMDGQSISLQWAITALGDGDAMQARDNARLLKDYWGAKVDARYIDDEDERALLDESRAQMADAEARFNAVKAWITLVESAGAEHHGVIAKAMAHKKAEEFAREADHKNGPEDKIKELIDEYRKSGRKPTIQDIEVIMTIINGNKHSFMDKKEFPLLETIQKTYPDTDLPQVFNLYYKYIMTRDSSGIYSVIEDVPGWKDSEGLVFIRMQCARDMKKDNAELLQLAERLVELAPDNVRYQQLKAFFGKNAGQ